VLTDHGLRDRLAERARADAERLTWAATATELMHLLAEEASRPTLRGLVRRIAR
jgi:hypothetical protein